MKKKKKTVQPIYSIGIIAIVFVFLFSGARVSFSSSKYIGHRKDTGKCDACHEDVVSESLKKKHIHSPVAKKRCIVCHLDVKSNVEQQKKEKGKNDDKIKWLGENSSPATEHWFILPSDKVGDNLVVEVKNDASGVQRREVSLSSLGANIRHLVNDNTHPLISEVKAQKIERDILLSATIAWKTDKVSTSTVRYGIGRLNAVQDLDNHMAKEHNVVLYGLKSGKTYQYQVFSKDIFGNRSSSAIQTFSTVAASKPVAISIESGNSNETTSAFDLTNEVFRYGGNYLLKIASNQPVSIMVGSSPQKPGQWARPNKQTSEKQVAKKLPVNHPKMKNKLDINSIVCQTCHIEIKKGLSHPVNVYPKPGMRIPAEYPTLADGRILCMSCHARHASDNNFRILKPTKKELCIGCHRDMV